MDLEQLLYEEESLTLDFKSEQYPFSEADDHEKSKLLKDILAFANSWRRTEAVILIGVKEIKGQRSEVIGIETDLEDANLQQFVNTKTQRPIQFSYQAATLDGKKVGAIRIPLQKRPIHLRTNFGPLKANTVYIRRGSSTAEAQPDEIADMGADSVRESAIPAPKLSIQFADPKTLSPSSENIALSITDVNRPIDEYIPDFEVKRNTPFGQSMEIGLGFANAGYYRDATNFIDVSSRSTQIAFCVKNDSEILANDVRIQLVVPKIGHLCSFINSEKFPKQPKKIWNAASEIEPLKSQLTKLAHKPDITILETNDRWLLNIRLDKVQAQQIVYTQERIFILGFENGNVDFEVSIFCDNLPQPIIQRLIASIELKQKPWEEVSRRIGFPT